MSTASWSAAPPIRTRPCCSMSIRSSSAGGACRDRRAALEAFIPYVEARLAEGVPLAAMTRHVLGLFNGLPGARALRRHLATEAVKPGAGIEVLREAMRFVERRGAMDEAAE